MCRIFALFFSLFSLSIAPAYGKEQQLSSAANANNVFALDLYSRLSSGPESLFFSPYSIADALTMVYAGSAGNTRLQMEKVLHLSADEGTKQRSSLSKSLQSPHLKLANSIWIQSGIPLLPQFQETLSKDFNAITQRTDFIHKPEEAQFSINQWVARHTQNRIQDLLESGVIKSTTRIILVSAIYMQADWLHPFKTDLTKHAPFYTSTQESDLRPFMEQTTFFPYAKFDTFSALELPYREDSKKKWSQACDASTTP